MAPTITKLSPDQSQAPHPDSPARTSAAAPDADLADCQADSPDDDPRVTAVPCSGHARPRIPVPVSRRARELSSAVAGISAWLRFLPDRRVLPFVRALEYISLTLLALPLLAGCATPSIVVFSPLYPFILLIYITIRTVRRLGRRAMELTWRQIMNAIAASTTKAATRIYDAVLNRARLVRDDPMIISRFIAKLGLWILYIFLIGLPIYLIIYAISAVLFVTLEIPFWIIVLTAFAVQRIYRAVRKADLLNGDFEPHPPDIAGTAELVERNRPFRLRLQLRDVPGFRGSRAEAPGTVDSQVINFWLREHATNDHLPVYVGQTYTGLLQVGRYRETNIVIVNRLIAKAAIPAGGLRTDWTLWSTTVRFSASPHERHVRIDEVVHEDGQQWMARFPLTIPRDGESARRALRITPLSDIDCTIYAVIRVNGDIYRELTIRLPAEDLSPGTDPVLPDGSSASELDKAGVSAPAGHPAATDGTNAVSLSEEIAAMATTATIPRGIEIEQLLVVPERHLATRAPTAPMRPKQSLHLLLLPKLVQISSDELPADDTDLWRPHIATVESRIANSRNALDRLRSKHQDYFDAVDPTEMFSRLEDYRPPVEWVAAPGAASTDASRRWEAIARSAELAELAFNGHSLYQALFPEDSKTRSAINLLRPSDRLSITWQNNGEQWISHVPWPLLYTAEPPPPGQPVDPSGFLGLRYRISYRAYRISVGSRALGPRATRAKLLYWGGQPTDDLWAASRAHATELARWRPLILPRTDDAKPEVARFLREPWPRPMGVIYLYCKCTTGSGADPVLRFGSTNDVIDVLRLVDLGLSRIPDQPLIFANACDTVAGSPYSPNQLEEIFFERGCRAFIGTECKVPVKFASRFAAVFFWFLYSDEFSPMSAGEALTQARLFFWHSYGNIGGLFYSYVNDDQVYFAADEAVAALSTARR